MSSILTTYARPLSIRSIPAGFVEIPCSQCQRVLNVPASQSREVQICTSCRRGEAERAVIEARGVIHSLIHGTGEFDCLSQSERQEQLDGFGWGARHTPRALPSPERTVFVASDEPIYTWDGEAPDPATRDEIESRTELEPFDEAFGA